MVYEDATAWANRTVPDYLGSTSHWFLAGDATRPSGSLPSVPVGD